MDAVSVALGAASDQATRKEHEEKLKALRTSLSSIEDSISKYENIIEECRMMEDEVRQDTTDMASQDPENEAMEVDEVTQEVASQSGSTDLPTEASMEDQPLLALGGKIVSPEEEEILMGATFQPKGCSPISEMVSISGELADLQLTSQPHPGPEEGTPI